jgi:hypothetical protein
MFGAGLDWNLLLGLAKAHRVRPLLIRSLRELAWLGVPLEARQLLLNFLAIHKQRSLFLAGQLTRVADQLSKRAIPFATFKGPSLAAAVYRDLSLREYSDIDIIVEKKQVAATEEVLRQLGYEPIAGSRAFRRAFLAYQGQFALLKGTQLAVDLHWDFAAHEVPFPLSPKEIWNSLEKTDIGGRSVPTLGRSDLALFLAGHGVKEAWRCLAWVCDFAMFIEKHPDLDWAYLLARARQRESGRALLVGCHLAAKLLGIRVKGDLLEVVERNVKYQSAAETAIRQLGETRERRALEHTEGDFALCESWLQRARLVGRLLFTRTVGDYNSLPLPRSMWRVYHLTRPFRLAIKSLMSVPRPKSRSLISRPAIDSS